MLLFVFNRRGADVWIRTNLDLDALTTAQKNRLSIWVVGNCFLQVAVIAQECSRCYSDGGTCQVKGQKQTKRSINTYKETEWE